MPPVWCGMCPHFVSIEVQQVRIPSFRSLLGDRKNYKFYTSSENLICFNFWGVWSIS